jgi:HEAT repeat protein
MNLETILNALAHHEPHQRDLAAAELGDLLRNAVLNHVDTERVVSQLVTAITTDTDPTVRESALNAIAEAFNYAELPLRLVQPLQHRLHEMSPAELDYALYILAATHDPAAHPAIEAFVNHPDPAVRRYTAEALQELPGRRPAP